MFSTNRLEIRAFIQNSERRKKKRREYLYSVHQWNSPSSVEIPYRSSHCNKDFGFSGISHVRLRAEFWVLQTRVYLTKDVHIKEIREYSYYMPEMKLKSFSRYLCVETVLFRLFLYFWDFIKVSSHRCTHNSLSRGFGSTSLWPQAHSGLWRTAETLQLQK